VSGITPRQRALLHTIYQAEGTWDSKAGRPIYNQTFGYTPFDTSKPHPDRVVRSGGYASAAAGAGQFMPATWKMVHGGQNPVMSPENQDRAALELVRRRGVDPDKPLDRAALNRLAPEWASLPTLAGNSHYGQPVRRADDLLGFYNQQLKAAPAAPAPGAPAAQAPAARAPAASLAAAPAGAPDDLPPAPLPGMAAPSADALASLLPSLMSTSGSNSQLASVIASIGGGSSDPSIAINAAAQHRLGEEIEGIGSSLHSPRRLSTFSPPPERKRIAGQALAGLASLFA
jgi:muramidase (phage lysozyme)